MSVLLCVAAGLLAQTVLFDEEINPMPGAKRTHMKVPVAEKSEASRTQQLALVLPTAMPYYGSPPSTVVVVGV